MRIAGAVAVIAAVICLLEGTGKIRDAARREENDEMIRVWQDHYQRCVEGYNDCMLQADYATDWYFKSSYQDLAEDWQKMMTDDQRKIDEIREGYRKERTSGTTVACISIPLIGAAVFLFLKGRKGG